MLINTLLGQRDASDAMGGKCCAPIMKVLTLESGTCEMHPLPHKQLHALRDGSVLGLTVGCAPKVSLACCMTNVRCAL
jgi:hypothetical protein